MSTSSRRDRVRHSGFSGVELLIALAIAMCCLVVWQWIREVAVHEKNGSLVRTIEFLGSMTNDYARTLESLRSDSSRVDEIRTGLELQIRTNRAEVRRLEKELNTVTLLANRSSRDAQAYKQSLDTANQAIKEQNAAVAKQNENLEQLKKIASDRNDLGKKYNTLHVEYETLLKERNGFVEQLNKLTQVASEKK
ncbi:MAG: hypothetical protein EXS36_11905 [Pedosphaera sp.]|nr:hypothetical protein [Pedosphaera sp.]